MPLTEIQSDILRLLAAHRDPESYVAGSTPLNIDAPRFSGDIDLFHDREERVARAAQQDSEILLANGFNVEWLRREPAMYSLVAGRGGQATKLEWVVDADFRFFPTMPDKLFGYILHPVDLATNKVMAAAGRREPRDIVDLLTIHDRILPIGAVIWAAVGKSLGFSPEGIINEIRRLGRYTPPDFERVASEPPIDPAEIMVRLQQTLDDASAFVSRMPTEKAGVLFLEAGEAVQPDPDRLDAYQIHAGRRRGHWPQGPDIEITMMKRYRGKVESD